MSSVLTTQLLLTLGYSSQFNFPLTLSEIRQRLVSVGLAKKLLSTDNQLDVDILLKQSANDEQLSANDEQLLQLLVEMGLVVVTEDGGRKYYLLNLNNNNLQHACQQAVVLRKKRQVFSARIKRDLKKLIELGCRLPWIKAMVVTGSVAANHADKKADLDLLVVTARNRLWLGRWLLLTVALLLGKKRWWWQKGNDDWCFNLWLTENSLKLGAGRHNFYNAYESCQMDWFFDKEDLKKRYLLENEWIKKFLPNWYETLRKEKANSISQKKKESFIANFLLSIVNKIAFFIQKQYLHFKNGISYNNLRLNRAFLHDAVSYNQYLNKWMKLVKPAKSNLKDSSYRLSDKVRKIKEAASNKKGKLVLVTGVFDIIHQEHINFLRKARDLGEWLVVGLETDQRVKAIKSDQRPINDEQQRLQQLRQTDIADVVFLLPKDFNEKEDYLQFLKLLEPDVLAVSSHTPHLDVKQALMRKIGGEVLVAHQHNPDFSTTKIIKENNLVKESS